MAEVMPLAQTQLEDVVDKLGTTKEKIDKLILERKELENELKVRLKTNRPTFTKAIAEGNNFKATLIFCTRSTLDKAPIIRKLGERWVNRYALKESHYVMIRPERKDPTSTRHKR